MEAITTKTFVKKQALPMQSNHENHLGQQKYHV